MKEQLITPDAVGISYSDEFVETRDQLRLHGWKLYSAGESKASLLFFHGNAENISTHFANVHWLVEHGYDVYVFDYRGYGQSQGEAELDPIIEDMQLLIGHVLGQIPDEQKLVVMGQSLGASLSIYATAHSPHRDRIAALVSVSAFSDYHQIAQEALAKSWVFWLFQWPLSKTIDNSYSPMTAVGDITPIPVVIMHSEEDEIIGFNHALLLYQAASEPRQLIRLEDGHNVTFNSKRNRRKLLEVLESVREREGRNDSE
ncbi:MAG: alpha/beta fold hydrolase [Thiotrichales bacterium]|nr:MAG: alpha/beta fold hydrolase [Thiotrichales bacterium]